VIDSLSIDFILILLAPALNQSNIGIAMGSGTAVAQQAAGLVIVDDRFTTIVTAVQMGRAIYANIQKSVKRATLVLLLLRIR
jgi:P-type E1-E2 ATPase